MARAIRCPPGRAGRLWVHERLSLARRAVSLLDTKLLLLRREHERFAAAAEQAYADWRQACRQAQEWERRAVVGGSARSLRLRSPAERADVSFTTSAVMGITFPAAARVTPPPAAAAMALVGSSALAPACAAYRRALERGAGYAAAAAARDVLAEEVATTQLRLRALRDRWIPALERTLSDIELALDELERADAARLRWAGGDQLGGAGRRTLVKTAPDGHAER